MPLSRWDNLPKVMDVKLNQVPFVVLCLLSGYKTSKNGTYPITGHGREIVMELTGSMAKISGIVTTEYAQISPFVRVGTNKNTGMQQYKLLVPIFDYDTWSVALGNPDQDTVFDYSTFCRIVQESNTLVFSRVES